MQGVGSEQEVNRLTVNQTWSTSIPWVLLGLLISYLNAFICASVHPDGCGRARVILSVCQVLSARAAKGSSTVPFVEPSTL